METNKKNEWIEDVLHSTDEHMRMYPREGLFEDIISRAKQPMQKGKVISISMVSAAAACILLLLAVDVYSIVQKNKDSPKEGARAIVQYYNITNDKDLGAL